MTSRSIWIGFDPREQPEVSVCCASIRAHLSADIEIHAVALDPLTQMGLYQRPTEIRDSELWDVISDAPMSTEFAISRFFIPQVCSDDWALFMDCDMLVRADLVQLFDLADPTKAIQVVQHDYAPVEKRKMDGKTQTTYSRKNWSSVMLWNLQHPANKLLTGESGARKLNSWAGRALHQFAWLEDSEIGALPREWNHLVGVYPPNPGAKIAHFTLGSPRMPGYEKSEFADEWLAEVQTAPSS